MINIDDCLNCISAYRTIKQYYKSKGIEAMRKNAHRKVLALLLAVMNVGQSLSLTSFADSSTPQTDSSISAVGTQSNETSQSFVIDQTNRDAVSYPDKGVSKTVNSDGKNDNAPKLTAGYDIDSPTFDLRNVNGKSYMTPVRS